MKDCLSSIPFRKLESNSQHNLQWSEGTSSMGISYARNFYWVLKGDLDVVQNICSILCFSYGEWRGNFVMDFTLFKIL